MKQRPHHRPRHPIGSRLASLLPYLGFRYSGTRQAYVLRGIGNRFGPVLQQRRPDSPKLG